MKVTLIGHACVFVEMDGVNCIMDPVFGDPFEEGVVASCPKRVVHEDALPKIDVIVISHAHLDHFDIPTLAKLPRSAHVVCPKDQTITYALDRLGFTSVHPSDPFKQFKIDRYELITTLSSVSNVVEFGMVFKDRSGTFWNQVDSVVLPGTIDSVRERAGKIDLLFAMHASQNFDFFQSRATGFPYASHEMNLSTVARIAPTMVVPGAAGFRFCGPAEWANPFLFPISRERFLRDLKELAPSIDASIGNPGDVFEVSGGKVTRRPAAARFASMVEDDTAMLRFDPSAPLPPLTDPNPPGYMRQRIELAVEQVFEGLSSFVARAYSEADAVVDSYRDLHATYSVRVVFPEGDERVWRVAFEPSAPRIDASAEPTDATHAIAGSALAAWLAHERTYFYRRAFSRPTSNLYALEHADDGVRVAPREVQDLLDYYLNRKAPGADLAVKRWLDKQLAAYGAPRR